MVGALAARSDFPLLARRIDDRPITYLDSAAMTLKPTSVIERVTSFYREISANIHRGNHTLGTEASEAFEGVRGQVARFLNATAREIIFTHNATEGFNLVGEGLDLQADDNVVASVLEHHSNILPWMRHCQVRFIPEGPDGLLDLNVMSDLIDSRTRLVALTHASNVTGAVNPVSTAIALAHERGIPVMIDGCQSVPHFPVDVTALGCDFLAFSSYKMLGPAGVGVLYARESTWPRLRPLKLGGGTIDHVRKNGFDLKRVPHRFEAGTPNIEGVVGFGAALEYLENLGMDRVAEHDAQLSRLLHERLAQISTVRVLGPSDPARKVAIAALVPNSPHIDVTSLGMTLSDSFKVMARAGTHCAHPYFAEHKVNGSLRLSSYVYTTEDDILTAANAIEQVLSR